MAILATIDWLNDKPDTPWIGRILTIESALRRGLRDRPAHFFVINRRYDEGIAFYRKALELAAGPVERALAAGHQPDAPGPRGRGARAAGTVLTSNGYHDAATVNSLTAARQLQELRHLRDRPPRSSGCTRKKPRCCGRISNRSWSAPSPPTRRSTSCKLDRPGAGGSLSRPRRLRRAHHGHARPGRAGRDVRLRGRDGQPVRPHAGQRSIGPAPCGTS